MASGEGSAAFSKLWTTCWRVTWAGPRAGSGPGPGRPAQGSPLDAMRPDLKGVPHVSTRARKHTRDTATRDARRHQRERSLEGRERPRRAFSPRERDRNARSRLARGTARACRGLSHLSRERERPRRRTRARTSTRHTHHTGWAAAGGAVSGERAAATRSLFGEMLVRLNEPKHTRERGSAEASETACYAHLLVNGQ